VEAVILEGEIEVLADLELATANLALQGLQRRLRAEGANAEQLARGDPRAVGDAHRAECARLADVAALAVRRRATRRERQDHRAGVAFLDPDFGGADRVRNPEPGDRAQVI